ncbi:PAS domain S-box protein [Halomicroarcula sp. F13]|uniref:histidine kinase n=1 Tax=Haloarcula rubra TaxID=2487747 RepID=A0AAW4PT23_9EURY|nr:PAS domain S-box protein [Halomicroarcula rubra]MBX0324431.1 PAS domain S-box protein [Halomicroarcula rubra]
MNPPDNPITVLYVTADSAVETAVSASLAEGSDGMEITAADDVSEARETLEETTVDCLVVEDARPETDSHQFLRAVREDHPNLPVLLFGSARDESDVANALAAGATDYVQRNGEDAQYAVLEHRIRDAVDRHRARRSAESNEQLLTQLAERTDDILFAFDGEWRELLFVNSAYEDIWDRSIARLKREPKSFLEFVHPEDRSKARASMERLSNGTADEVEYRVRTEDGEQRWVRGESKPILDDDGDVIRIVGFVRDITEHRERERDLQQQRDRFRAVFEEAFDAMVILDDDRRFLDANESAIELFGLSREALLGRPVDEFIDDGFDEASAWQGFIDDGSRRGTFPLVRSDGEERIVEYAATSDVVPGQHLSVIRDMTDQREYEQRLERREQRYRNLVEDSPAPINLFDADGDTVWCNDATVELLGVDSRDELVGRSVFDFIHPDDHGIAEAEIEAVIHDRDVVGPTEFRLVRDDGDVRHVRVKTTSGWWQGERVGQAVVIDVTEQHRYEERLTTLHDRMREMTRAEERAAIADVATETLTELLDFDAAVFYEFDGSQSLTPLVQADGEGYLDESAASRTDGGVLWTAFVEDEVRDWDREQTERNDTTPPFESGLVVPIGNHGVLVGGLTTDQSVASSEREITRLVGEGLEATLDRAGKASTIQTRDRQLQQQNRVLEQVNRLNEIIREIVQTLVRSSTRAEIRADVCEQFATANQYTFAWWGERDADSDAVTPEEWQGVDSEFVDELRSGGSYPQIARLVEAAYHENEIQVAGNILDDDEWKGHRSVALSYGYQSIAAVPVGDSDYVDAVLVIHADAPDTFDERERTVLDELGDTIGYALHNVPGPEGMQATQRTEVELQITTDRLFTNRLTAELRAEMAVVGMIRDDSDTDRLFCRLRGTPADVAEKLTSFETVRSVQPLSVKDGDGLYQLRISTPPLVAALRASDATLRTLTAEGGTTTLVTVLSESDGVRSFIEEVRSLYPETTLLARRENPTPVEPREMFHEEILDELTDRQLDALKTAHFGGFYEWPRETTSSKLAETRDIAASTYQYHLRAAERKIISAILDAP